MNIVICSDSFKDSLSSDELSYIISQIISKKFPKAKITCIELADGGEGSLNALETGLNADIISHCSLDSLLRPIEADFLHFPSSNHIVIELAQTCGLGLLNSSERNCFYTSTYGFGLQILKALEFKPDSIDLLIGGSATNDLGVGMAAALSCKFYNQEQQLVQPVGKDLNSVSRFEPNYNLFENIKFKVVTDVDNILLGDGGATYTYGKQKGASAKELDLLEAGAKNIVKLVSAKTKSEYHLHPGAGAAGGVGYGAMVFLGANKQSGIEYMIDKLQIRKSISEADLVVTGEGKLDNQTLNGKLISGVCKLASEENKKVVAICALNELRKTEISKLGLSKVYPLYLSAPDFISKENTEIRLEKITQEIINDNLG